VENFAEKILNILIVEDDELNIKMVSSFLKGNHNIFAARSGEEALQKSLDTQFDIILMDIGLKKEMSGIDVTHRLRKMSNYQNTPIIALTAYALSGDKQRIIEAGCSHYLSKPFTKNQLLSLIDSISKSL
jgi:CheY-like chemotaxis protein